MIAVASDHAADAPRPAPPPLYEVRGDQLHLNFHAGQWRAFHSPARFVAVLAGTQGGKTSYGPFHLWNKIRQDGAGGDYLAVTSSYDLFKLKMLPAMRDCFENVFRCGRYWSGDRIMELADPSGKFWAKRADDRMWGRIILRSAESGSGLESTTAKGAWLDEAGQDAFTIDIFYAILRRLSLSLGWLLITTTLYNFGALKSEFYDRWARGEPGYEVVHFDSTENPLFPQEEFERARLSMPLWKFNMQYRGLYERPAGWIYDSFDADTAIVPRFSIPAHWPRYLGLDFGGVNTAAVYFAGEPGTDRLYLYREYKAGGRTAAEHARALLAGEPSIPEVVVGGSKSEGQWRDEFKAGGLPVREPAVSDVEVGINRVYGCHARGEIFVFPDCTGYLDQKRAYSRKLDAQGEPTEAIEAKDTYHYLDAERYIVGWLRDTRDYTLTATANPFASLRGGRGDDGANDAAGRLGGGGNEFSTRRPTRRGGRLRI